MGLDISFSQEQQGGKATAATYKILGTSSTKGAIMDMEINIDFTSMLLTSKMDTYEGDSRVKTSAIVDKWHFENSAWEYEDSANQWSDLNADYDISSGQAFLKEWQYDSGSNTVETYMATTDNSKILIRADIVIEGEQFTFTTISDISIAHGQWSSDVMCPDSNEFWQVVRNDADVTSTISCGNKAQIITKTDFDGYYGWENGPGFMFSMAAIASSRTLTYDFYINYENKEVRCELKDLNSMEKFTAYTWFFVTDSSPDDSTGGDEGEADYIYTSFPVVVNSSEQTFENPFRFGETDGWMTKYMVSNQNEVKFEYNWI